MAADPGCQAKVIRRVERGPGHGGETRREKSREEGQRGRGGGGWGGAERKAGQGRECRPALTLSPQGLSVFTELSVTWRCISRGTQATRAMRK